MNRRLLPALALLVVSFIAIGGCGSEAETSAEPAPEWLFSLQATDVTTFDQATSQLTMPVDSVLAFTDRPFRLVELEGPQAFADLWKDAGGDSFVADPPNVVVTWWPPSGGYSDSMQVASIVGTVTYDSASSSLVMTLATDGEASLTLPSTMEQVSLFVDGFSSNCGSTPTGGASVSTPRGTGTVCINDTRF